MLNAEFWAAVKPCEMLQTAFFTQENEPANEAFVRSGIFSSITREGVAGNKHALFLNEQQFIDHNADLRSEFEERAGSHSYLESRSVLTGHGYR